jgi:hypothetical protein
MEEESTLNPVRIPELSALLDDCDHVDIKTVESSNDLRTFIAGMLNYNPWWIASLFRVRGLFARFLGLRHEGAPGPRTWNPGDIPFEKDAPLSFFTVHETNPDRHFIAYAKDKHLIGYLAIIAEATSNARNPWRYRVVTIVKYLHWTGPVYFNAIRPFHHIVVQRMAAAGARENK